MIPLTKKFYSLPAISIMVFCLTFSVAAQIDSEVLNVEVTGISTKTVNLNRGKFTMSPELQRLIFNPYGTRDPLNLELRSLDRDLRSTDIVYFAEPSSYKVSPDAFSNKDIRLDYIWEVVSTQKGILVAIPIPIINSLSRIPIACGDCGQSTTYGRCYPPAIVVLVRGCLESVPNDKNCLQKMDVTDPCIKQKTAQNDIPVTNLISNYTMKSQTASAVIYIASGVPAIPISRKIWDSSYIPGIGCFLNGPAESNTDNKAISVDFLITILEDQGLASRFEYANSAIANDQYYELSSQNSGNYVEVGNQLRTCLRPCGRVQPMHCGGGMIYNQDNEVVLKIDDLKRGQKTKYYTSDREGKFVFNLSKLPEGYYTFEQTYTDGKKYYLRFKIVRTHDNIKK